MSANAKGGTAPTFSAVRLVKSAAFGLACAVALTAAASLLVLKETVAFDSLGAVTLAALALGGLAASLACGAGERRLARSLASAALVYVLLLAGSLFFGGPGGFGAELIRLGTTLAGGVAGGALTAAGRKRHR